MDHAKPPGERRGNPPPAGALITRGRAEVNGPAPFPEKAKRPGVNRGVLKY